MCVIQNIIDLNKRAAEIDLRLVPDGDNYPGECM